MFELVDGPAGTHAELEPVPIPEAVERYHQAVSALRKAKRVYVGSAEMDRALRILHGLAAEAERRGFDVRAHLPHHGGDRSRDEPLWHLLFTTGDETVPLRIEEEDDRVEHVPTSRELKEHERRPWVRIPTHDHLRSGRLRIQLGGQSLLERKSSWADRASWRLEEKLPAVLREVAVRADELRLLREAKARAHEAHRQAVEREEELAYVRAAEAHRVEVLDGHLTAWRAAEELRADAMAVANRITDAADGQDAEALGEARRWLDWVRDRADRRNPTTRLATWPKTPELASYELRKFMRDVPEPREIRYHPDSY